MRLNSLKIREVVIGPNNALKLPEIREVVTGPNNALVYFLTPEMRTLL